VSLCAHRDALQARIAILNNAKALRVQLCCDLITIIIIINIKVRNTSTAHKHRIRNGFQAPISRQMHATIGAKSIRPQAAARDLYLTTHSHARALCCVTAFQPPCFARPWAIIKHLCIQAKCRSRAP
jgi:hypothetical protein